MQPLIGNVINRVAGKRGIVGLYSFTKQNTLVEELYSILSGTAGHAGTLSMNSKAFVANFHVIKWNNVIAQQRNISVRCKSLTTFSRMK